MSPAAAVVSDPRTSPPALPALAFLPGGTPNGVGAIVADAPCLAACGVVSTPQEARYYYRARYYDPKAGRFISEDPISVRRRRLPELNAYPYVANDPANYGDPEGLQATRGVRTVRKIKKLAECGQTVKKCKDEATARCRCEYPPNGRGSTGVGDDPNWLPRTDCENKFFDCCWSISWRCTANVLIPFIDPFDPDGIDCFPNPDSKGHRRHPAGANP